MRREVSDELRLTAVETMVADKRVNKRGELERCTRAEHEKGRREEKRAVEGRDTTTTRWWQCREGVSG